MSVEDDLFANIDMHLRKAALSPEEVRYQQFEQDKATARQLIDDYRDIIVSLPEFEPEVARIVREYGSFPAHQRDRFDFYNRIHVERQTGIYLLTFDIADPEINSASVVEIPTHDNKYGIRSHYSAALLPRPTFFGVQLDNQWVPIHEPLPESDRGVVISEMQKILHLL